MSVEYTIPDAARLLGVSGKTVRRRLLSGQLSGHKVDNKWTVVLPDQVASAAVAVSEVDQLRRQVVDLESQLAEVAHDREWLRQHADQLTMINGGLTAAVSNLERLLLPAPGGEVRAGSAVQASGEHGPARRRSALGRWSRVLRDLFTRTL
jgi:hypothetical protein